jgi:hypothetical protein
MIRYDITPAKLRADIQTIDPTWLTKADKRTQGFIKRKKFNETSSIWSTVKPAFMRLQMNKCVYCERQFESIEYGKIEFDVEHYRPKSSVVAWPQQNRHPKLTYQFSTGAATSTGYYWLAYSLENYAASCKPCNTNLKSNNFPIAGKRGAAKQGVKALLKEMPLLCYPLGNIDDDPERLVTFVVTTAIPAAKSGHKNRRGRVIIDFFDLNREQLHRERARMIGLLVPSLEAETAGRATAVDHQVLAQISQPHVPHLNCLRAFQKLWKKDLPTARRAYDWCRAFAFTAPGTAPPPPP